MKLSTLLNELLDRGYNPEICSRGFVLVRMNIDRESFGFSIVPDAAFLRVVCWEAYGGSYYFDRHFESLDQAIFASMMAATLDDAKLTETISHIGR